MCGPVSIIPRPSTPPVFDRLQYAYCRRLKTRGEEGLGMRLTGPHTQKKIVNPQPFAKRHLTCALVRGLWVETSQLGAVSRDRIAIRGDGWTYIRVGIFQCKKTRC